MSDGAWVIEDGDGQPVTVGAGSADEAEKIAQSCADSRGRTVYLYFEDSSNESDPDAENDEDPAMVFRPRRPRSAK